MSLIKDVRDELAAMSVGIGYAHDTAAEAEEEAGDIEERAAAAGFIGIADVMSQVRDAIQQIRAGLSAAGDELGQAHAPKQTTPEQAIAALTPATHSIGAVYETITATIDTVDDTQRLISAVLDGGEPGPMLSRLDTIKQELDQLASRCGTAKQRVEAVLFEARQTGDAGEQLSGRVDERS